MKLSKKLAKLRKIKKLNQLYVANQLGVARQTISNWETGVSVPDAYQLMQLAKVFNVSIEEIMKDVEVK